MNPSTPCDRLWRKRLNELSSVWPAFIGGRTTGLHKTRVASRRIREALPIVGACAPQAKVKKLNRKMRKLTRYLGPIRELDVKLDMLEAAGRRVGVSGRALELVRREVASRRQALRSELGNSAPIGDLKKLIKKLERIVTTNGDSPKKHEKFEVQWRGVLATRLMRRARDLGHAVDQAGSLYAPDRVHEVRIAIKKLRYALEIAHDARVAGAAALVRTMKRHQERLGRLHDFEALLRHVRETEALPGVGSQVYDLTAYADSLERDCRRHHAGFVEHRSELMDCIKDVRLRIVPALTTSARRQATATALRHPVDGARARAK